MLRGGSRYVEGCWGFPYLKISKILVSWFLGFLASRFISFLVSWFLGSNKLPNYQCMFSVCKILISYPRFQDFTSLFGACLFETCRHVGFHFLKLTKIVCFKSVPGLFLVVVRYPLVLGARGTFKSPEIIEMSICGLSHKQIEKLLIQIEAE